jgi:hypothetical protein
MSMRRRYYPEYINPFQETLDRLKLELYEARWALTNLGLLPDEAPQLLHGYVKCESREETYGWERAVVEGVIALAKPVLDDDRLDPRERAFCPLCGGGSNSPYYRGFTLEGLRRHLAGWGSRSNQCDVMSAAMSLAREYWHKQFHESDMAEERLKRERLEERRRIENLYRTELDKTELVDEGIGYGNTPRDESGMAWAEERLAGLGFEPKTEGNVKSYTDEREDFVVFADPRRPGEIRFQVYRKSLTKGKTPRVKYKYVTSFGLSDKWKNDLRGKYESRLPQPAEVRR